MTKRTRSREPVKTFSACGEDNGNATMTPKKVKRLRALYKTGEASLSDLARAFNLHHRTAGQIAKRITWRHVP